MPNHDVIVIGGSAGSTGPLKTILAALPPDFDAAIFVVIHIPARSTGILATVASAAGPLPVHAAEDGVRIEPGHVYVAAPDHHLILADSRIKLGRGPRENMVRPAVDALFRSAAMFYGPRVIGVVLSGMMNDGAAGLKAIKQCGGLTVVQDPADAFEADMPTNALRVTEVDVCAPAADLGPALVDLSRSPPGPHVPVPPDIQLEVEIAAGGPVDSGIMRELASPSPLTCPSCHGVLSEVKDQDPLRYRCQVGHAYTADILAKEQEASVDEALRVALRVIEERVQLVSRMAREARETGRSAVAELYEGRAEEYRSYRDTIRKAIVSMMAPVAVSEPVGE